MILVSYICTYIDIANGWYFTVFLGCASPLGEWEHGRTCYSYVFMCFATKKSHVLLYWGLQKYNTIQARTRPEANGWAQIQGQKYQRGTEVWHTSASLTEASTRLVSRVTLPYKAGKYSVSRHSNKIYRQRPCSSQQQHIQIETFVTLFFPPKLVKNLPYVLHIKGYLFLLCFDVVTYLAQFSQAEELCQGLVSVDVGEGLTVVGCITQLLSFHLLNAPQL